jgi:hypothetical protein
MRWIIDTKDSTVCSVTKTLDVVSDAPLAAQRTSEMASKQERTLMGS